jgi:hypothetical protein
MPQVALGKYIVCHDLQLLAFLPKNFGNVNELQVVRFLMIVQLERLKIKVHAIQIRNFL